MTIPHDTVLPTDEAAMNSVAMSLKWLRAHDHPKLFLNASVRQMMEKADG